MLGWSDSDFWAATPKKYFAVFDRYCEMKGYLSAPEPAKALVGRDAFNALAGIASKIR